LELKRINDDISVSPQISPDDMPAVKAAGFVTVINNRPDGEAPDQPTSATMQAAAEATASGMVSILLLDAEKVASLCQAASAVGTLQIANYLCPGNIVVSGSQAACQKIVELAEQAGGRTVQLAVAGAFHTEIMQEAQAPVTEALAAATISPPRIPVISNVDAAPHSDPAEIRQIRVRQIVSPVLWEGSVRKMLAEGVDRLYEIGPGTVLKGLLKRIDRKIECTNINDG